MPRDAMTSDVIPTAQWDPVRAIDLGSARHLDDLAGFISASFETDDRIQVASDVPWRQDDLKPHERRSTFRLADFAIGYAR
jgi:hypothetical protein